MLTHVLHRQAWSKCTLSCKMSAAVCCMRNVASPAARSSLSQLGCMCATCRSLSEVYDVQCVMFTSIRLFLAHTEM